MQKQIYPLLLIVAMLSGLAACGDQQPGASTEGAPQANEGTEALQPDPTAEAAAAPEVAD